MKKQIYYIILFSLFSFVPLCAQILNLPPRPLNAPKGSVFVQQITSLTRQDREDKIYQQIASGNIPEFMRVLCPVSTNTTIGGTTYSTKYYVTPEYMAVGSDDDYFLCPMTPILAQRLTDLLNCTLPTRKMVNEIYAAAPCKFEPQPIPPSPEMTTVPVFNQHNSMVWTQRSAVLATHPLGTLVGGTKKDVVISNLIYNPKVGGPQRPVVIYGWHKLDGTYWQPLYNGHEETYADYSHGIRFVQMILTVNNSLKSINEILTSSSLYPILSDEGAIPIPRYPLTSTVLLPTPKDFCILTESASSLRINIAIDNDTTNYFAFLSKDGLSFTDSLSINKSNPILIGLSTDSLYYIRLRAFSPNGTSAFSEVLAGVPSAGFPKVLIVNGFDRGSSGNTYNFIRQHGNAFFKNGSSFCSATNTALLRGLTSLSRFEIVDYILGDESTADETFSTSEQETLKTYLKNGGKLFVSGAEIGWDLDYKGSTGDKDFYHNYLKAQYMADAPYNTPSVYYRIQPVQGKIFDGLGIINFDNGTNGTINVKYPDVIKGVNGGTNCFVYSQTDSEYAGIYFEGLFPGGIKAGKIVNLGVPFETFFPEQTRIDIANRILTFFNTPTSTGHYLPTIPKNFELYQNFPNPFNPETTIGFQLSTMNYVTLRVYDVLGREIAILFEGMISAGEHFSKFNFSVLSSGVYYYSLQSNGISETKKMVVTR